MKAIFFAGLLMLSSVVVAHTPSQTPPQTPPTAPAGGNIPKGLKQYFIGFLVQGEKWAQTPPKQELAELMQQHLAYIRSEADAGEYKVAGPFLENGRIRGFVIIEAVSAEEAATIVNGDPMIKSGRMAAEIHPVMMADMSCVMAEYQKNTAK